MNNDNFTVLVSGGGTHHWVSMCTCVAIALKMTEQVEQWICIKFFIKLEHSSAETSQMIQKPAAIGNWWLAASPRENICSGITSVQSFWARHQITQVTQPHYSPDLAPCNFWLFPKLKSSLKVQRFQTVNEIQENTTGQLMVTGRTVWGPKVPTVKGTEVSLSFVQCFLYLVSSSINVSIFHITWLDTFWTDLVYTYSTFAVYLWY